MYGISNNNLKKSMRKCLLWEMGNIFNEYANLVKYHEMLGTFKVVGVTSDVSIYSKVKGYTYISKNNLKCSDFEIIIIMAQDNALKAIYSEALHMGIRKENIFSYHVLKQENFDIDKYMRIKKNPPSIFSNTCWGGITYHSLDLEFTSPLINMYESTTDYLKLLRNPHKYMEEKLEFIETGYDIYAKKNFPIIKCGDIKLYFNHYDSFEDARDCWERRKLRIDWDNLFVMMHTDNPRLAKEFVSLPYKKKICFVPFESEETSLVYVELCEKTKTELWPLVTGMATGRYPYYDVFDLVEKGKLTKIVEFN